MATTRRCRDCGDGVMDERIGSRHYDESGLKGILLVGIPLQKCRACGAESFTVPRTPDLHRLIALALIRKPTTLTGAELKVLRKHLGYSQEDFAGRLDIARETLSRWETDAQQMSPMAERLLRAMVALNDRAPAYSIDDLAQARGDAKPLKLELRLEGGAWRSAAA
jgi:putative transcriptional regulator